MYSYPHGLTDRAALLFRRPGLPCEEIAEPVVVGAAGKKMVEKGEGGDWGGRAAADSAGYVDGDTDFHQRREF